MYTGIILPFRRNGHFQENLVSPGTPEDLTLSFGVNPGIVPRLIDKLPRNTSLDVSKIEKTLGHKMREYREGLKIMKAQLRSIEKGVQK